MTEYRIAITTAPESEAAHLARTLVEQRLAACVQIVSGVRSFFRWKGEVADEPEAVLLCKTTESACEAFERHLKARHSYEVPELIFVPVESGLTAYLSWISEEVQIESER